MIVQQLRKSGNSYVVTIPKEEVERNGWKEGQHLAVEVTEVELQPKLRPELREILDRNWDKLEPAMRYLADR
ncbi:MAG TPA: AbrB/MazE/SpoVT family DNA-binding domain-containing protein [Thermomicrobiales bacterium]|nr:AbrB/MazE/SpoVT family DNA-binding domain-containing protein [Thermomicrobiales bacterium]